MPALKRTFFPRHFPAMLKHRSLRINAGAPTVNIGYSDCETDLDRPFQPRGLGSAKLRQRQVAGTTGGTLVIGRSIRMNCSGFAYVQ
jgi:hypothetical protein